nr:ATP synthase F0 subunit 6 [Pennella sp. (in: crustaceans)]
MDSLFMTFSAGVLGKNWLVLILLLMGFTNYWLASSVPVKSVEMFVDYMYLELSLVFPDKMSGDSHYLISLMVFIFFSNFLGLFPYIFTSTSHLCLTVFLAIPLWLGSQFYSWVMNPESMFAHLVPEGAPVGLAPFLVIIELISNFIRPLTLSVRLMANMVAGHLLLSLLGLSFNLELPVSALLVMLGMLFLGGLELGVSLIQAYVFTLLNSLYVKEVM